MIDFFIIGVQKAATSSLADHISNSSCVEMPKQEVNVFLSEKDMQKNLGFFDRRSKEGGKVSGIKCPDYFPNASALRRIYRYNNNAKVIVIYRDPVERFVSAAYWYMQVGLIDVQDINDLIKRCLAGSFCSDWEKQLLEYGFYGKHYDVLKSIFDAENILILSQAEYRKNPVAISRAVLNFLGVDAEIPDRQGAKKKSIYNKYRLRVYSLVNRMFFYKFDLGGEIPMTFVRPLYIRFVYYIWRSVDRFILKNILSNKPQVVRPELMEGLVNIYSKDYESFLKKVL